MDRGTTVGRTVNQLRDRFCKKQKKKTPTMVVSTGFCDLGSSKFQRSPSRRPGKRNCTVMPNRDRPHSSTIGFHILVSIYKHVRDTQPRGRWMYISNRAGKRVVAGGKVRVIA